MSDTARNGSAYQMRRRLSIFQTMRHDSAKLGVASSVWAASSDAPAARRSNTPRFGSLQPPGEHDEHERREREDDERPAPAPLGGDETGGERADDRADRVRGAVERVHARPATGCRSSRRSASCGSGRRRPCRCPSPRRAMPSTTTDHARPVSRLKNAHAERTDPGDAHAVVAVGVRDAIGTCSTSATTLTRTPTRPSRPGQVEAERVADVREQHRERGAVELVDRVETEQHERSGRPRLRPVIPSSHFLTLSSFSFGIFISPPPRSGPRSCFLLGLRGQRRQPPRARRATMSPDPAPRCRARERPSRASDHGGGRRGRRGRSGRISSTMRTPRPLTRICQRTGSRLPRPIQYAAPMIAPSGAVTPPMITYVRISRFWNGAMRVGVDALLLVRVQAPGEPGEGSRQARTRRAGPASRAGRRPRPRVRCRGAP